MQKNDSNCVLKEDYGSYRIRWGNRSLFAYSSRKKAESMRSQFLWDGNATKRKMHLVKWQVVLNDKKRRFQYKEFENA